MTRSKQLDLAALTALAALALAAPRPVAAQEHLPRASEGIVLATPSVTEVGDATALSVNPANLGFLDSWSVVYAGAWLQTDQRHLAGQGHGIFLAAPLGPFGLGVSTEFMTAPDDVKDWQGLDARVRFSIGVSLNPIRAMGIGFAYRTFFAYDLGDIDTFDLSLSVRPVNYLALAFVMSDVNAPDARFGATTDAAGTEIGPRKEAIPRKFTVGLTVRPLADDRWSLGGELSYAYGDVKAWELDPDTGAYAFRSDELRRTDAAAFLSVMPIDGVTLRARFGAEGLRNDRIENGYFLDASLSIDTQRFPLGLQAGTAFKLAPDGGRGLEAVTWSARFSGDEPPTIPFHLPPRRVAVFAIEKSMDTYEFGDFVELLQRIEDDAGVDWVLLEPDADTLDLDKAQDVRRAIVRLKAAGRRTACYLTEATSSVYLACAAADYVWLNPAGGVRLQGISTKSIHFKSLLDKLGVAADIVRIGEYKSAPEQFTNEAPSDPSMQAMNRYIDSVYERVVGNLQKDRRLKDHDAAVKALEAGPYTANEALAAGLVDALVPADAVEAELEKAADRPVALDEKYGDRPFRHRAYIDAPAVAVVHIEGDLVDGESLDVPILDLHFSGAKTVTEELKKLAESPDIQAVVLRIDSPGGSALASDLIWRQVMLLREKKPVIASLGAVAASGAYYIASAADFIYAEPTTLTGSIGIFYGKADVSGLLDKVGIDVTTFKRGAHADMESWTRPYTPEERRKLLGQISEFYNLFLDRVVEGRGRGFTREVVDKRGRGRIWSGADAKQHLLVDELGGYAEALSRAKQLAFVADDTEVFHVPKPHKGLIARFAKMLRASTRAPSPTETMLDIPTLRRTLRAAVPFAFADQGAPQARLPFGIIEGE
jgi:protease IV